MCGISWDIIVSIDILWTCEEDDQSANVRFPAAWRRCWQKLKLTWMSPAGRHGYNLFGSGRRSATF